MNALRVRLPLLCPRTSGPSSVSSAFAPTQTRRYTTLSPSTHRFRIRTPQAIHSVQSVNRRSMASSSSSSSAPLQEWLVIAPDFAGALEKRLAVRNEHLAGLEKDGEDFWLWGGAMLDAPLQEGEAPKMKGSAMLCGAKTKEEVLKRLERDVYVKGEVWDWSKVQIIPFKSALRKPL